eukprot:CAMPEP_0185715108 /NCGR_PEP_ID=MMETSP1164-20130828/40168_1 /TAXON_ID=1104430 /ORGANISM="Chrysoreinhardia sp, Strain CCMP2950" /LENGTH=235 /DNA_ID=CAMNT_0028382697 /DNA_START=57 /DNA_END=761 /DNA_ORIENTATION=-
MASTVGVADVLAAPRWPATWPYSAADFARQDETPDRNFYAFERFVYHVDEAAVAALTAHYDEVFRQWDRPAILDLCASHVSHFPAATDSLRYGRRVALGMNAVELDANTDVDERVVQDLNADPTLPFEDASFDIVTNCVSIDYLTKPLEITREVARVLKPGGAALFALSNRCFPSKAVNIWLRTNDLEHVFIVGSYFHYAGGFDPPSAVEVSPNRDSTPWMGGTSQNIAYLAVVR